MHGIFGSDAFRNTFLNGLADPSLVHDVSVETTLAALAAHLSAALDLDRIVGLASELP
jgi:adenosylcobyric acid synthase